MSELSWPANPARWPTRVGSDLLAPPTGPIPLLCRVRGSLEETFAWVREECLWRQVLPPNRMEPYRADVALPWGTGMVFEHQPLYDSRDPAQRADPPPRGLFRYRYHDGSTDRFAIEISPDEWTSVEYTGLPNDPDAIVVAEGRAVEVHEDRSRNRYSHAFSILSIDGSRRPLMTVPENLSGGFTQCIPLQASPDGQLLAISVRPSGGEHYVPPWVALHSMADGRELVRLPEAWLVGRNSWSPDGRRLLVRNRYGHVHTYDVAADQLVPHPELPTDDGKEHEPFYLGFAGNDSLLVAWQRGKTMWIYRLDLTTLQNELLIRFTGAVYMRPVCALMPDGYWD